MTRPAAGPLRGGALLVLALVTSIPSLAEEPARTRTVVAGERYRAGALHRLFLGTDYRDLWTTPIEVEVLDLGAFAGGLQPVKRVGGQQTRSLALRGADGRSYTFRSLDKDPTAILPPDLQDTLADRIVQDQIAAGHPAGAVVAARLLEAAGVLHATPSLVVLPDDPALGEFRETFAGVVGSIEEFPGPGFAGATEVLPGEEAWARFEASPADRPDPRAFLRARLLDLLIGDWDRHRKQWRWARIRGQDLWQPIPEDRDQAFSRFEGLALGVARNSQPRLLNFGPGYPGIEGLAFNGWEQDRAVLAPLEWPAWEEVATDVQRSVTNAVIEEAVGRMPAAYRAKDGPRMTAALAARREGLQRVARSFYGHLARELDVPLTAAPESVDVRHLAGGEVEIRVSAGESEPFFHRRLFPAETREIRIRLGGGDDRVVVGGRGVILVRVVGDTGSDLVDDSAGGGTRFSDADGRVVPGPGTHHDQGRYVPPPPNPRAPWTPPRDWGRRTVPAVWLSGGPDVGAFLGGGITTTGYGFRKDPFADRQRLRAGWATTARTYRAEYEGEFRFEDSPARLELVARASGIEILRFYGFGNGTSAEGPDDTFKVEQEQYTLAPALAFGLGRRASVAFGPVVQYATTDLAPGRVVTATRPYGVEAFGQVGARLGVVVDTRDRVAAPSRGLFLAFEGRGFPQAWDVDSAFGEVHGEVATYLTPASPVTLALRAGGKRVFGTYPFHEAAFVGGASTVRGFRAQRFAGDGAAWGNAEVRLFLTRFFLLMPGEMGVFVLGDAGRVWLEGEESDRWHTAVGGGVWFAFLHRSQTVSVAVARSRERTGLYVRGGFAF